MTVKLKHKTNDEIKQLQNHWQVNGWVQIDDFLSDLCAQTIQNYLMFTMPNDWWSLTHFSQKRDKEPHTNRIIGDDISVPQYCYYDRADGHFCYAFERTTQHYSSCKCTLCVYTNFLDAPVVRDLVNQVTHEEIKNVTDLERGVFASRYKSGHFLSPHTDSGLGALAFVYSLTSNWHPYWGGNLHLLEDDAHTIKKVIQPRFNSICLFKVHAQTGAYSKKGAHFVSDVNEGVQKARLSITGWFT